MSRIAGHIVHSDGKARARKMIEGSDKFGSRAEDLKALQQEQGRLRHQSAVSMMKILCHVAERCAEANIYLRVHIGQADTGRQSWGTAVLAPLFLEFGPNGRILCTLDDADASGPRERDAIPNFSSYWAVDPHEILKYLDSHSLEEVEKRRGLNHGQVLLSSMLKCTDPQTLYKKVLPALERQIAETTRRLNEVRAGIASLPPEFQ